MACNVLPFQILTRKSWAYDNTWAAVPAGTMHTEKKTEFIGI